MIFRDRERRYLLVERLESPVGAGLSIRSTWDKRLKATLGAQEIEELCMALVRLFPEHFYDGMPEASLGSDCDACASRVRQPLDIPIATWCMCPECGIGYAGAP